jgi:antirestriction protein
MPEQTPHVYCQPLAAYNEGILCGAWLPSGVEDQELWDGVERTLAASPIPNEEEFGWFDYDNYEGIKIEEYDPVDRVAALGQLVVAHKRPFAVFYNCDPSIELEGADEAFRYAYIGEFESEGDLAWNVSEDIVDTIEPEWTRVYFDSEKYLNDLSCNGDLYFHDGFAFWTR